jgi:ferredoxin
VVSEVNVDSAAKDAEAVLAAQNAKLAEQNAKLNALFAPPPAIDGIYADAGTMYHLSNRDKFVGNIDSSELLDLDEAADLWPVDLPQGERATDEDMLWIDELSCIGCTWCADVARTYSEHSRAPVLDDSCACKLKRTAAGSTFKMTEPYGTAQVIQQGGDSEDVVAEAIDCCPNDCIHHCTRDELELLEQHRACGYMDDLLARCAAHHRHGLASLDLAWLGLISWARKS